MLDVCGATFVGVLNWIAGPMWLVLLLATSAVAEGVVAGEMVIACGTNQSAAVGACCMIVVKKQKYSGSRVMNRKFVEVAFIGHVWYIQCKVELIMYDT